MSRAVVFIAGDKKRTGEKERKKTDIGNENDSSVHLHAALADKGVGQSEGGFVFRLTDGLLGLSSFFSFTRPTDGRAPNASLAPGGRGGAGQRGGGGCGSSSLT